MARGDVELAHFPFGGTAGTKVRPVLLLTDFIGPASEVLVAYITSVMPATLLPTDIILDPAVPEHASTNLKRTSLLRLHKLSTIHQSDIVRHVGTVSATVWAEVEAKLRLLLNL